jgi:hypothetical protein
MAGLERARRYAEKRKRRGRGGFHPIQVSAVNAWLRLAASTPVSSEYETIVDVLNSNPAVHADRKCAATTAANGLPTMTFDGSDVVPWPLAASNFNANKFGLALWLKPGNITTTQSIYAIYNTAATLRSIYIFMVNSGQIGIQIFIGNNTDGRQFNTANGVISAGVHNWLRFQFDSSKTNEADTDGATADAKVRLFTGTGAVETARALTGSNIGAGGTLSTLRTATGSALIGGLTDADAPTTPLVNTGVIGPNVYILDDTPTAAQGNALMGFEVPT